MCSLSVRVYVEADYRAVDAESAGAERRAGREASGKAVGDLLLGSREVGLADVQAFRDGGVRPRLEVDVPEGAVVELRRWFRHFLQDIERCFLVEDGRALALPFGIGRAGLAVGEGDKRLARAVCRNDRGISATR